MKMLTVSALVCAMMILTGAAEPSEATTEDGQTESHLVNKSAPCSTGWFRINDRWFHFVPQAMTWAKAEKNCQSLGGNLASIQSLQEYQQIQKLAGVETWVGGSDAQEEGQWFWSDGSSFDYRKWCPGEPNNIEGLQHCLQINHRAKKCWDDLHCSRVRPSLCAMKV